MPVKNFHPLEQRPTDIRVQFHQSCVMLERSHVCKLHVTKFKLCVLRKCEISLPSSINRKQHGFLGVFGINTANVISKFTKISRTATRNRAISYTYQQPSLRLIYSNVFVLPQLSSCTGLIHPLIFCTSLHRR